VWSDMSLVLIKLVNMLKRWRGVCKEPDQAEKGRGRLEARGKELPRLTWDLHSASTAALPSGAKGKPSGFFIDFWHNTNIWCQ
jgi:hypothetical protein